MRIYSYSPEKGDSRSKTLAFCILGGAAFLVLLGEFLGEYKPILQTAGFVVAIAGIMICSRFLLSGYTYIIEGSEDGKAPDLVIIENRGKVNRTVCRVSASGGRLFRADGGKKPDGRVYDYRPSPFVSDSWIYVVPERDGDGFVRFSPDEKMIEIMRSLGCEVQE